MIDLHLHTTASDGRLAPADLVAAAQAAGIATLAVTDHDTVDGVAEAEAAGREAGVVVVPGIEATARAGGRDVHVLGYFVDVADPDLASFLRAQRDDRRRRLAEMVAALERLGAPVDPAPLDAEAETGRAMGRPLVAAALVDAGHAADIGQAFDRFLAEGRPAYVPRRGAPPADVIARLQAAGGLASVAHPGKTGLEALVRALADEGLDAVEVFHPDHDDADRARYARLARDRGLLVTGGSDYHGPGNGRADALGTVGLPAADFERLAARARWPRQPSRG